MNTITENPGSSLANLEEAKAIDKIGLQLPANLSLERLEAVGHMLSFYGDAVEWARGDFLIHAEKFYPEEASQISEALGISEESRRQHLRVALAIPRPSRRAELSWSHHRAVAGKPDQDEWLTKAVENDWTKRDLEDHLREAATSGGPPSPTKAYVLERVADAAERVFAASVLSDSKPDTIEVPLAEWELLTEAFGLMDA